MEQTPDITSEGVRRIAAERQRQIEQEGWNASHDDRHRGDQMANAAACYAMPAKSRITPYNGAPPKHWPWDYEDWKPTPHDRIRELEKAGALIAAEIDRLLRSSVSPQDASGERTND